LVKHVRLYLALISFWSLPLSGQEFSSYRVKSIPIAADSIVLDSLTIAPETLVLLTPEGDSISKDHYRLDINTSTLILEKASIADSLLIVHYRVFPINLTREVMNKDLRRTVLDDGRISDAYVYKYKPSESVDDIFRMDGLSKSGSIARGISFGNNQDVVVNSNFNLQLSGRLSPEVEVLAAISDNNIPIQPYGNSQVIQDFDKVFIQLSHRKASLIAGDFDLGRPPGYFMNFFKRLQGGMVTANANLKRSEGPASNYTYNVRAAGALSKGKFARNQISGIEGNQGPYKLTGSEGENFIIVLAGSERVYIDGMLMSRGENLDYVIDYNTAEISFTPNVLITKDIRIVVEFEYSNNRYARSLFFAGNEFRLNRTMVRLNVFSEQDLKNQSLEQDLSDEDKKFLSGIGDDLDMAYQPGYDSVGYSSDEIRYAMVDTIHEEILYDSVFVLSSDPDIAYYRVRFSNVGINKGSYIQKSSSLNGRVYEWVAPVNGIPQGDYAPVRFLVTPKKTQMFVINTEHNFQTNSSVKAEVALSNNDINTFSSIGDADDLGLGVKLDAVHLIPLSGKNPDSWILKGRANYEYTSKKFEPIEWFRPVEFERDWNLTDVDPAEDEHLASLNLELSKKDLASINYIFSTYLVKNDYKGFKNSGSFEWDQNSWKILLEGSILNTRQEILDTRFIRQRGLVSKRFGKVTIGLRQELENNVLMEMPADSLRADSFSFFQWEVFLKSPDTVKMPYNLFFRTRTDRLPKDNSLEVSTVARDLGFTLKLLNTTGHRFTLSSTYRALTVKDSILANQEPEENLLGRLEHFLRILKGTFTFNTFYEAGSGLDRKQEFYYLKVPAGEGLYTWIDFNGDGIQQLNEFEIAAFKDQADFIRVFVQSDEYVRGYYNRFTFSFNIQPAATWQKKEGIRGFVAKFSNQLVYRTESKSNSNDPVLAYNPFVGLNRWNDTSLVSLNSSFRNTLYFNRMNPKFNMDLNFTRNNAKTLLINGFENRRLFNSSLNLRWNFYKDLTLRLTFGKGKNERRSEEFSSNNYSLDIYNVSPSLIWQVGVFLRVEATYNYEHKKNVLGDPGELAIVNDAGIELNYRIASKGNLLAKGNLIRIDFNGESNTSLSYEMLNGLQPGNNATWSISYQQNLSRFLQLNVIYDGRKSGDASTVHVGSLQVRAHF